MSPNNTMPDIPSDQPEYWSRLLDGANVPAHLGNSLEGPPKWLEQDKFIRGQEFTRRHLVSTILGYFMPHVFLFAWKPAFRLFANMGKTNTYKKLWKRNITLLRFILSWCEGGYFWDTESDAHRTMKTVQILHKRAGVIGQRESEEVRQATVDTTMQLNVKAKCNLWTVIRKDMSRPENSTPIPPLLAPSERCNFSQLDSAVAILLSITAVLTKPKELGIHDASDEDLEGVVHFWRVIAYYAGMDDKFNPCAGSLAETRSLCWDLIFGVYYPALKCISEEDEYFARLSYNSVIKRSALGAMSFDCYLLLIARGINLKMPTLYRQLSWFDRFVYAVILWATSFLMRSSLAVSVIDQIVRNSLSGSLK